MGIQILRQYIFREGEITTLLLVPKGTQWDFMEVFGQAFKNKSLEDFQPIRPVIEYKEIMAGFEIFLTILNPETSAFVEMCKSFCKARGIQYENKSQNSAFD